MRQRGGLKPGSRTGVQRERSHRGKHRQAITSTVLRVAGTTRKPSWHRKVSLCEPPQHAGRGWQGTEMTSPQVLIQKAYITLATPADVATFAPLAVQSVASQVHGLLNPDPSRFTSEPGSGIVYDPLTGLMWAQDETDELDWDASAKACAGCRLGGYSDWYQPNRYEQQTILDLDRHGPCLPPIFKTHGEAVWTSTKTAWTKDKAGSSRSFFYVGLNYGGVGGNDANGRLRARPVRRASPASQ